MRVGRDTAATTKSGATAMEGDSIRRDTSHTFGTLQGEGDGSMLFAAGSTIRSKQAIKQQSAGQIRARIVRKKSIKKVVMNQTSQSFYRHGDLTKG